MLFQVLAVIFSVLSGIVLIFSSRIKMVFFRLMRMMGGSKNKETPEDKEGGG
jgi:hypothetical protein